MLSRGLAARTHWIQILHDKNLLPEDHYRIYRSLTKYSYVQKNQIYEKLSIPKNNHKNLPGFRYCQSMDFRKLIRGNKLIHKNQDIYGIPQGSPISGVLSNLYMMEFDKKINSLLSNIDGKYYRYCDDMLFIIPKGDINEIKEKITDELNNLKLTISESKTQICIFSNKKTEKPLQYLGFLFDGQKIILRSRGISKHLKKSRKSVRLANATRKKYNKKSKTSHKIYRKKLYLRHSYNGKRNFIQYGHRAAKIMSSSHIKKQLKPLWKKLKAEIDKADTE